MLLHYILRAVEDILYADNSFKRYTFLHMRKHINQKYDSPTKSKAYSYLAFSEINKTMRYILFIMFIALTYCFRINRAMTNDIICQLFL